MDLLEQGLLAYPRRGAASGICQAGKPAHQFHKLSSCGTLGLGAGAATCRPEVVA